MSEQFNLFQHGGAESMHGRGAVLSDDGLYRYRLWRIWDHDRAPTCWVMLNPSTADATADDPTLRKCVGFTKRWGGGGVILVNLFAWRATDPADLERAHRGGRDVRGPDRDAHIRLALSVCDVVVCAWGAHTLAASVAPEVLALIPSGLEVCCLGRSNNHQPRHPLMLGYDTSRRPFGGSLQ